MHGGVLLEGWCQLFLDGLVAGGAREVVVSPGSRSTPLVLAALRHADLDVEVVVDERAAAFFALGRARVSGRPPVLVRTSGSAGGHDLPAVIEARAAGWPMVVVTADRPPELQGACAPQTIDQVRLFGAHAVGYFDLGPPSAERLALRAARRVGVQAAARARAPEPGAVQVNLPARKPLEPPPVRSDADAAFSAEVAALRSAPGPRIFLPAAPAPTPAALEAVASVLSEARRPLVVAGPSAPLAAEDRAALLELVDRTGVPAVLEATSQLRFGPGGRGAAGLDVVLREPALREALAPDVILQLGAPPIGMGLQASARAWAEARRVVIAPRGFPDPDSRAWVVRADPARAARALLEALPALAPDPGYLDAWARAAEVAPRHALAAPRDSLDEGAVARAARAAVPPGGRLVVGNSLPVRHLDVYVPAGGPPVDVLHQRGASGIDGLVAGAVAASRAGPTVLLLGDVSARHDLGGLALADLAGPSLTVVVIHNAGGRIFEALPVAAGGRASEAELRAFTTPDARSLVPAAEALGWAATEVGAAGDLEAALAAPSRGRPRLIEARVPSGDAEARLLALRARIASELGPLGGGRDA
jgi:2-succinyl-5-enolpyruvyl-6-hydroxy-3-cyclohexene-1-carboxylate synthase